MREILTPIRDSTLSPPGRGQGEGVSPRQADRVVLAIITAPHGVKGMVRIKTFTAEPDALARYAPLETETGERIELDIVGAQKGVLLARVKGIADRDQAERLKGARLYLPRAALPAPEEDEYYHADLLGLPAELGDGTPLGTVRAIHGYGAGDSLEIERETGAPLIVPFTRAAVPVVDLARRRVVVAPPEEN
jgi:16S rRNA processing protein RimM